MKLILFLALTLAHTAWSAQIDPKLKVLMRNGSDTRIIRVILSFENAQDLSRVSRVQVGDLRGRSNLQKLLIQNAKDSQSAFLSELRTWKNERIPFRYYSLWLTNGMILDLPANV